LADHDFAIVADDIMLNGSFLLRQTLSEWYQCALWFPGDLEGYSKQLEDVPRVLFIGESSYSRFFKTMVGRKWDNWGIAWGCKRRTAVILSHDLLDGNPDRMRDLDMELARLRRDIRVERVTNRRSPGVRAAAKFLDPFTAMRTKPPSIMSPGDHVHMIQYQIAIAEFLTTGFDAWCWGEKPKAAEDDRKTLKKRGS